VDSPTPAEARALVAEVRAGHARIEKDDARLPWPCAVAVCDTDRLPWPCDASRLADALSASLAEVERLKESFVASEHLRQDTDAALVRAG
jgi:hypothetical protein